jgi:hypothetical protein
VLDELDAADFVDAEGAVGSVDDDILTGTTRRSAFTADQPPPPRRPGTFGSVKRTLGQAILAM